MQHEPTQLMLELLFHSDEIGNFKVTQGYFLQSLQTPSAECVLNRHLSFTESKYKLFTAQDLCEQN